MNVRYTTLPSPVGNLWLAVSTHGVRSVGFVGQDRGAQIHQDWQFDSNLVHPAIEQLDRYFAGELRVFDLPLDCHGTAFQREVWDELTKIPYGQTRTYGQIAHALGRPTASRAVGAANGMNPIAIIVPCHRVIGSTGKLTGFAGGLSVKERLLSLESKEPELFSSPKSGQEIGVDTSSCAVETSAP